MRLFFHMLALVGFFATEMTYTPTGIAVTMCMPRAMSLHFSQKFFVHIIF
jgi:hypothetical protein